MWAPSPNNWHHKLAKLPPGRAGSKKSQRSGSNRRPHRTYQSLASLSKPQKQQWVKLSGSLSTRINNRELTPVIRIGNQRYSVFQPSLPSSSMDNSFSGPKEDLRHRSCEPVDLNQTAICNDHIQGSSNHNEPMELRTYGITGSHS